MRLSVVVFGSLAILGVPVVASAQAYLGEPNSLSADLGYVFAPSGKIILSSSEDDSPFDDDVPNVPLTVHVFNFGLEYNTPAPGLVAQASLPLMGVKLGDASFMHAPIAGEYDDGDTHFTFTDFRGGLRYQIKAIEEYLGLSLGLATSIPVRDYPDNGFAAVGTHLKALHLGAAIARTFDPVIPNLFFQFAYEYSIREKVDDTPETEEFSRNTTEMNFTLGYFLPVGLTLAAAADVRMTHDGVAYSTLIGEHPSVILNHDRLLDEDNATVGGDLGYSLTEQLAIAASARFFVWGKNTRNHNLFGLNLEYTFF